MNAPKGSDIEYEYRTRELERAELFATLEAESRHAEWDRQDDYQELIQD